MTLKASASNTTSGAINTSLPHLREVFVPLCSVLVRPKGVPRAGVPSAWVLGILGEGWQRAMKMMKRLEHLFCEERLRMVELFGLEKRLKGICSMDGRVQSSWSWTLLGGSPWKDRRDGHRLTRRVTLKHKKETDREGDQTVGQVGQRAGNPGNTQNLWEGRKGVEQGGERRERGVSALTAKLPTPPGWEGVPLGSCTPSWAGVRLQALELGTPWSVPWGVPSADLQTCQPRAALTPRGSLLRWEKRSHS